MSQIGVVVHDDYANHSYYYWPFMNGTNGTTYESIINDVVLKISSEYHKWLLSICGCILVGLSGIFPLLLLPQGLDGGPKSSNSLSSSSSSWINSPFAGGGINTKQMKSLLCFAVGSLLGDVFLHLLPEAWMNARMRGVCNHDTLMHLGFWILGGLISFVICEKLVSFGEEEEEGVSSSEEEKDSLTDTSNNNNDKAKKICSSKDPKAKKEFSHKQIAGYLNLVANGFDNFTHGLAVAGSFIVSPRIGFLTTAAILLHEIPHEIGDFAILLRSGFNPWSAAKAQLSTASVGLAGAVVTLAVDCMKTIGNFTWWILPFTSGGFLSIALTNLLPDLLREDDPKESCKQLASLVMGIAVMGLVTLLFEG